MILLPNFSPEVLGAAWDDPQLPHSVDEVLKANFTDEEIGGESSFGSHRIKTYMACQRRAFLSYVKKLTPTRGSEALDLGTLVHACLARHYKTGGKDTWRPTYVVEPYEPKLAAEARRLLYAYFEKYGEQEAREWDTRAVEYEIAAELTDGKRHCPLTARLDLLVAKRADGAPPAPYGRVADGVWSCDHKCQIGSSLIRDYRSGTLRTTAEWYARGEGPSVLAFDEVTGKLVQTQANAPERNVVEDVFEVIFASGRRLSVGATHPFWTPQGWIPGAGLSAGSWCALPSSTAGYNGVPRFKDAEVAFVGAMLGDGTLNSLCFCKSGPVFEAFKGLLNQLGYEENSTQPGKSFHVVVDKTGRRTAPTLNVSHDSESRLRILMEGLGLFDRTQDLTAPHKFIPREMLSLPDRQAAILLGWIWNTDGCVETKEEVCKNRPNVAPQQKVRIAHVSRSQAFCEGSQRLLLQLGIPSTVTSSTVLYKGVRLPYWITTVVTRPGKRKFLSWCIEGRIPFLKYPEMVRAALAAVKPGDDREIPTALIFRQLEGTRLGGFLAPGVPTSMLRRAKTLTMDRARTIDNPRVQAALDWDVTWDEVKSVLVVGRELTYSIEVPKLHTFVVNDIITHNTAARMSQEYTRGYAFDFQLMTQAAIWKLGNYDAVFGPLNGFIINIIIKSDPPKFTRLEIKISDDEVARFLKSVTPQALDLYAKMQSKAKRADEDFWPQNMSSCTSGKYLCKMFDWCESNGAMAALYRERK